MAHAKNHDYHILPPSVWPFVGSIGAFVMLSGAVFWMKGITHLGLPAWSQFALGLLMVLYTMYGWWSKVHGHTNCPECGELWTYLLECPGCQMSACPKCQAAIRKRRNARRKRPRNRSSDFDSDFY